MNEHSLQPGSGAYVRTPFASSRAGIFCNHKREGEMALNTDEGRYWKFEDGEWKRTNTRPDDEICDPDDFDLAHNTFRSGKNNYGIVRYSKDGHAISGTDLRDSPVGGW